MFNETLDEIINGLFAEPTKGDTEEQEEKKFHERWRGIFQEPFIPGTRVIYEGKFYGTIIDHTDPSISLQPRYGFELNSLFTPLKDVCVIFDRGVDKWGGHSPYWICNTRYLTLI